MIVTVYVASYNTLDCNCHTSNYYNNLWWLAAEQSKLLCVLKLHCKKYLVKMECVSSELDNSQQMDAIGI